MRITVVLATWNGRRYLEGQLGSLVGQTRTPDEVVVVDDASDDDTLDILERFAEQAPFKVHIQRCPERVGSTLAFEQGIRSARGDLIALCDQDDLWLPQKLARLARAFDEQPDATFAFSDALLIDGADVVEKERMWDRRRFHPRLRRAVRTEPFGQLSHRWLVTGCTMAFRTEMRDVALPFPVALSSSIDPMVHDRWLSLVLSAIGPVIVVDEPLVAYRLHAEQQIGLASVAAEVPAVVRHSRKLLWSRDASRETRDYQLMHLIEVRERLARSGAGGEVALRRADEVIALHRFRLDLADSRLERVPPVAREGLRGHYHRYGRGTASMLADVLRR